MSDGKIRISGEMAPENDNPKLSLIDANYLRGGYHVYPYLSAALQGADPATVPGLLDLHPNKMKLYMPVIVGEHNIGNDVSKPFPSTEYVLLNKPVLDKFNNFTPLSLDEADPNYYLNYWQVKTKLDFSGKRIFQYAPNYLGGIPPIPYIETEPALTEPKTAERLQWEWERDNWSDTLDSSKDHRWMRFKDGLNGIWSVPINIGAAFESGDYVENRFMRSATKPALPPQSINGLPNNSPAGWTDEAPAGTDKLWMILGAKNVFQQLKGPWIGPQEMEENGDLIRYSESSSPSPETVATMNGWTSTSQPATLNSVYDLKLVDSGWVSQATEKHAWKAKRTDNGNGTYSAWVLRKIKDESGQFPDFIFKLYDINVPYRDQTWIDTNRPQGIDPTGWSDTPLPIPAGSTMLNMVSKGVRFYNREMKEPWGAPVPHGAGDLFSVEISYPLGDDYKFNAGATAPLETHLPLNAELYYGHEKLWETRTITYSWHKILDNGTLISVVDDGDPTTENLPAAIVHDGDNYILSEGGRVLEVKHTQVTGKAVFKCVMLLQSEDGNSTMRFTEEASLLDITDGIDAVYLQLAADQTTFINKIAADASSSVLPNFITLTAHYSNIDTTNYPLIFEVKNTGDSAYTALVSGTDGITISGDRVTIANTSTLFDSVATRTFRVRTNEVFNQSGGGTKTLEDTVSINKISVTDGTPGDRFATTSTTSIAIPTVHPSADISLTVEGGLAYIPSQSVVIAYDAANYFQAVVKSYNKSTGAMVVNSSSHTGSGTFTAWDVNLAGAVGQEGPVGPVGKPILAISDNENQTVQTEEDGTLKAGQAGSTGTSSDSYINTEITVYEGDTLKSTGITYAVSKKFVNGAESALTTGNDAVDFGVYNNRIYLKHWGNNVRRAEAFIKVDYTDANAVVHTRYSRFTLSSVIDYPGATLADIDSVASNNKSYQFVPSNRNPIALQALLTVNGTSVAESAFTSITWKIVNEAGGSDTIITSTDSTGAGEYKSGTYGEFLHIRRTNITTGKKTYKVEIVYKSKTYQRKVVITDVTDNKTYRLFAPNTETLTSGHKPTVAYNATSETVTFNGVTVNWTNNATGAVWESIRQEADAAWSNPIKIKGETGSQGLPGEKGNFFYPLYKTASSQPVITTGVNRPSVQTMLSAPPSSGSFNAADYGWIKGVPVGATDPIWTTFGEFNGIDYNTVKADGNIKPIENWFPAANIRGNNGAKLERRYAPANSNFSNSARYATLSSTGVQWTTTPNKYMTEALINGDTDALINPPGWSTPIQMIPDAPEDGRGFLYRGTWAYTTYNVDDVVQYNNSLYICTIAHTAGSTTATPTTYTTHWSLFLLGFNSRGSWMHTTYYPGDVVYTGNALYRCHTTHTSSGSPTTTYLGLYWNKLFEYTPPSTPAVPGLKRLWVANHNGEAALSNSYSEKIRMSLGSSTSRKLLIKASATFFNDNNDLYELRVFGAYSSSGTISPLNERYVQGFNNVRYTEVQSTYLWNSIDYSYIGIQVRAHMGGSTLASHYGGCVLEVYHVD